MNDIHSTLLLGNSALGLAYGRELSIEGHLASELVQRFGSPLVVIAEGRVRQRCREYREALSRFPQARAYYASKAFLSVGFCRLIAEEGLGIDVVSAGELLTALRGGFPSERIMMHGNAKGEAEIRLAIENRVGRIVIDNLAEIGLVAGIASSIGARQKVLLRVTPGVQAHTHEYVQTGQLDSKFGFNIEGGAAEQAVREVMAQPALELCGIHCHIGSQIFEVEAYDAAARAMLAFYALVKEKYAPELSELNLGGGLGVKYRPEDQPPGIAEHIELLAGVVEAECARLGIPLPALYDEPGRSIVGDAGLTIYTVQSTKLIPGIRNYVSIDGGITDNPRFALYRSYHHCILPRRLDEAHDQTWAVSGKCCETGDMLSKDALLPEPRRGDLLALLCTGAYTYSMASNYNRVPRPAVVLAGENGAALLARRETPEETLRLDEVPAWL